MSKKYEVTDIEILEGLEAVRLRPGMYIGTTSAKGLHHTLWEIVDNAIDEFSNGYGDTIKVIIYADGSISVEDNGRGIPVEIHPKLNISGVEVVFTRLHAGGKFNNNTYVHSGGLHGVGASVTNALSEWLKVEVYKNKKTYSIEFEAREIDGRIVGGVPKFSLYETGVKSDKNGTLVRFKPDKRVFETTVFSLETISKRLKELAFLNKGLNVVLIDERVNVRREYCFDGGLSDFVGYLNETKSALHDPLYFEGSKDNIHLAFSMQWTDCYTESIFSYVNNIPTAEGGAHETGFKAALTKAMNDYARRIGALKDKEPNLFGEDFREGITAVISVKMNNVQFEGQTKNKLGNPEARIAVEAITSECLQNFFQDNKNNKLGELLLKKAILAAKVREAARKEKEITRAQNKIENATLVGKLSACTGKKPENNELFIVEGDSAGGTAKQARDRSFQAILPLRGKPLNAEKKRIDQILANEEIRTIISALGSGIGESFNIDNLNYHKIIILADADQDGAHIRAILLTFFFRYMKELITNGHLFIGMPPLYKISKKGFVEYAFDDAVVEEVKSRAGRGAQVQRYKGLGEMNAEQLWETTISPKMRSLIQVTIDDAAEAEKLVTVLMGDAVELRKQYIIDNANFNKDDKSKLLG